MAIIKTPTNTNHASLASANQTEDLVRLNVEISRDLRDSVKTYCITNKLTMREAVTELLSNM